MTLKKWRRNLLDLGLRNPLLNYRLLKARGVQIVGETSADVYTTLVKKQMPMTFKVRASEVAPEQPHLTDKHCLQTTHAASELQKRLRNSAYHARTHIDNRGINTLFLALGMLRWYEPNSDQQRSAPLLLIPVTLTRENIHNDFHIQYTKVDLNENRSLRENFRQEFNLEF
ncbi:MAG: DUF4011 domain-containing protein, partial [Candidatus Promineifilaceae bacterium]